MQDDSPIQIVTVVVFFIMMYEVHMGILFIIQVKIFFVLIGYTCAPIKLTFALRRLPIFKDVVQSILNTCLFGARP